MILTDEEFKKEAIIFLNKQWEYFNEKYPFDIESLALEYVKTNNDFRCKDEVEAGVLVNFLEEFGYIKFSKKEKNIRYHSLTEEGLNFIKQKKQKQL